MSVPPLFTLRRVWAPFIPLLVISSVLLDGGASAKSKSIEEIYKVARPAVALVTSGETLGSGFIADSKGLLVTNNHVVGGNDVVVKLVGRKEISGVVVARDPDRDIAIVALPAATYSSVKLAPSSVEIGQAIAVIGNPHGLEATISSGIVSGTRQLADGTSLIQISAPISQGSSGGPVFDLEGRAIGVASLQLVDGQNLNFAVPIAAAAALLKKAQNASKAISTASTGAPGNATTDGPEALAAWLRSFQAASDELRAGISETQSVRNSYISIDPKFYAAAETLVELSRALDRLTVAPVLNDAHRKLRTAVSLKLDEVTLFEEGCRVPPAEYRGELERSEAKRLLSEREVAVAAQGLLLHLRAPADRAFVARYSTTPDEDSRFIDFSAALSSEREEVKRNPWAFWWLHQGKAGLARDTCEEQEPSGVGRLECIGALARVAAQSGKGDHAVELLNHALAGDANPGPFASHIEERIVADVAEAMLATGDRASTLKILASAEKRLRGRTFMFGHGKRLLGVYRKTNRLKEGAALFGASSGPEALIAAVALNADLGNLRAARSVLTSPFPSSTSRISRALLECLVVREGLTKAKPEWSRADYERCIDTIRLYPVYEAADTKVWNDLYEWGLANQGVSDEAIADMRKKLTVNTTKQVAALAFLPGESRAALEARLPSIGHPYAGTPRERTLVGASVILAKLLSDVEGKLDALEGTREEVALVREWLADSDAGLAFPSRVEKMNAQLDAFLEKEEAAEPAP